MHCAQVSNFSFAGLSWQLRICVTRACSQSESSQHSQSKVRKSAKGRALSVDSSQVIQSQTRGSWKQPRSLETFWSSSIPPLAFMKKTFAWYSNSQTTSGVMSPSDTMEGRPMLGWETVARLLDMLLVVCC